MSQLRDKRRNNIRAGVFVSLSIILGLIVFAVLTKAVSRITTKVTEYKIAFTLSEGIGTLSSGSKVRLGGVLVGDVLSVTPRIEKNTPTSKIDVTFQMDTNYTIYSNATIHSRSGLLGDKGWLSISDVGSGEVATLSTQLHGSSESMVSQLLGRDAEMNISKSLSALRKISEALSNEGGALTMLLGAEESQALQSAIASARDGLSALDSIFQSTDVAWPSWKSSITTILSDSEKLPAEVNATLQQIQEVVQDVTLNILPNVEQASKSLKNSLRSLELMSETYQENSPLWAEKITDIVQKVKQISDNIYQTVDDIKADPWQLLYRPKDSDIKYGQLNAASWRLLSSLTELNNSIEMLEELSLSPNAPTDTSNIMEMLHKSKEEFEQARLKILEHLKQDFPKRR